MSDEVDYLQVDKHENFLQIDTWFLMGMVKHSQSSRNSKLAMSLQYSKRKLEMKLFFCVQINTSFLNKLY